jgi:DNA-binding CsgD family transcriptional regulator
MRGAVHRIDWLSRWVDGLGVAAWVRDPCGVLAHVNAAAASLLGIPPGERLGLPCHQAIQSCDAAGAPFCGPDCPILRRLRAGSRLVPQFVRLEGAIGKPHWLTLVVLPFPSASTVPWLVHCALPGDDEWRMRQYLQRVAMRPPERLCPHLTTREGQVLELLVRDLDAQAIAVRLHMSYATVRNHIQHILAKLEAHSIEEVVALRVLGEIDEP